MRLRRDMFTLADFNITWPKIARVCGQAIKRNTMQIKDHRCSQPKWSGTSCDIINHIKHAVKLRDGIFRLPASNLVGIANERRVRCNAMPLILSHINCSC